MTRPLRVLTWHVHGSYLENLARVPHELFLPVRDGRPEGYGGRLPGFDWGANVHDVPVEEVGRLTLDVVVFQSRRNWEIDQHEILSAAQRRLPRIYLEHDPPREVPTDTSHVVDEDDVLLVHVTPFNDLMWDSGRTPTRVIDHGVVVPAGMRWTGQLDRGLAVVNCLERRGRRAGADVFLLARRELPLDLVGMESEQLGGLGEVPRGRLAAFEARYRFFFNPIRYTSLGLAVLEAMAIGMPVVGLATTEMATAIENGVSGYVDTNMGRLVERMRELLGDRSLACQLGEGARRRVLERFHIDRFVRDWDAALRLVGG
ncbi:MAG: glycosyltransferase family 4 protein [Actinomycetota bacterium]|nr:glycosyltransferase family 4 protein [Actinomycetota bacterium]